MQGEEEKPINSSMKLLIAIITLSIMFVSCSVSADSSNLFRTPHCSPHVQRLPIYQMTTDRSASTAVLVGPNTYATSSHGISDGKAKDITIYLPGGVEVNAIIAWFDKDKDIATLSAKSYNIRPIDSMSFNIGPHEQVWNIGYPSMANGELMSYTGFYVRYKKGGTMVVSALGLHGMSGGATVRCIGERIELIGIITALVNHKIESIVWTDEDGILHQKETITNNGISITTPMRFQSSE